MPAIPVAGSITPGYSTKITFDGPSNIAAQTDMYKAWSQIEITGNAGTPGTANVTYVKAIGWLLSTIHDNLWGVHEEGAADNISFRPENGNAQFADAILAAGASVPLKRYNNNMPGVPRGSQVNEGDYAIELNQPASQDYGYSALTPPAPGDWPTNGPADIVPLDTMIISNSLMSPDEWITLRFWCPHFGGVASLQNILRLRFSGPAQSTISGVTDGDGIGQYAITLRADGTALLEELASATGGTTSIVRGTTQWSTYQGVSDHWHFLYIKSDCWSDGTYWYGNNLTIESLDGNYSVAVEAQIAIQIGLQQRTNAVKIVNNNGVQPQPGYAVLEIRRDVYAKAVLSYTNYLSSGTLQTQTFTTTGIAAPISSFQVPIQVTWGGSKSANTNITIALFDSNGNAATPGVSSSTNTSGTAYFTPVNIAGVYSTDYYAVFTLTTSDPRFSPRITNVTVNRPGIIHLASDATPFNPLIVSEVSITNQSSDPSTTTANVTIHDINNTLTALQNRSGMTSRIDLYYDPVHPTKFSIMHHGRVLRPDAFWQGPKVYDGLANWGSVPSLAAWPAYLWSTLKVSMTGMWTRCMQALTADVFNFGQDPTAPTLNGVAQPWKVTDVIHYLLSSAGFPDSMLDIPDSTLRLWAGGPDGLYIIAPYTPIIPYVQALAHDFLGGYLLWDENATNGGGSSDVNGCWRIRYAQRPDSNGHYNVLCGFQTDATWTDAPKQKFNINSWPTTTNTFNGVTQTVVNTPIVARSIKHSVTKAEGNFVVVSAVALQGKTVPQSSSSWVDFGLQLLYQSQLTAWCANWPTHLFYDGQPIAVDPTHPDYEDGEFKPIIIIDSSLAVPASPEQQANAIAFRARRAFDIGCHARYTRQFMAPMVLVTDQSDSLQIRPRPLRFGDAVTMQGQTWFINSVAHDWSAVRGGSRNALSAYEIFRMPGLMDYSIAAGPYSKNQIYSGTVGEFF